ncbi:SIS domain-containing protein [Rubrivivax sp. A210]|uniref:SIS domain-containing protein n=1 Tax=Rubrivivax sp. A210 TaxID=2772301 RepID=UPI001917BE34|nr:SIS domain-containing protein [Rubrivivax sp. A210]
MSEQRIQQQFFDSADVQYRAAEVLAQPIDEAASALLAALTNGGKVMVGGSGAGSALAPYLAQLLTGRFERERPPLAALALAGPHPAHQVRALGLPGDVLLFIDDGEGASTPVISAAQGKDMTIVVLAGRGAAAFGELLADTDVLVAVPHERPARVAELQLLALHCLCDAVDFQLMGDPES